MGLIKFPFLLILLARVCEHAHCAARLGDERIVFQTKFGNLELALYPEVCHFCHRSWKLYQPLLHMAEQACADPVLYYTFKRTGLRIGGVNSLQVAPVTARHILKLAKMGAYNTVNFFRVDRGFVAQTADVVYGRLESCPLDNRQSVGPAWLPLSSRPVSRT